MKPVCSKCPFYSFKTGYCRDGFEPFVGLLHTFEPPMPYDCREEAKRNLREPNQLELF